MSERFQKDFYQLRRKFFKLFGNDFHIYDDRENVVLFSKMKGLKLKEDLRIYESENMNRELLVITTDEILDFGATYDVTDPSTGEHVGSLKRKGLKSMARDEWIFMDSAGNEVATLKEDSLLLALVRRFVIGLIPQTYHVEVEGREVATFKQNFNPFLYKLDIDFTADPDGQQLDRRLGLAAAVLLGGVEGKQG